MQRTAAAQCGRPLHNPKAELCKTNAAATCCQHWHECAARCVASCSKQNSRRGKTPLSTLLLVPWMNKPGRHSHAASIRQQQQRATPPSRCWSIWARKRVCTRQQQRCNQVSHACPAAPTAQHMQRPLLEQAPVPLTLSSHPAILHMAVSRAPGHAFVPARATTLNSHNPQFTPQASQRTADNGA